jgi:hypothetical protein
MSHPNLDRPCAHPQAVTSPAVGPLLEAFNTRLGATASGSDRPDATAVIADRPVRALQLRTYPPMPGTDDRDDQVMVTVYGVDVSIRRRDDGLFVHIDSGDMPDCWRPLIVEVNCAGETHYHDVTGCGDACDA